MLMNGDKPFLHPVTGTLIQPYQWYEGAAHQEHENVEEPADETKTTKRAAKPKPEVE